MSLKDVLLAITKQHKHKAPEPAPKHFGRPPKGERAMTKAERQKAYRDRKRQETSR
jgi:hypothetical protein